MWGRRKEREAPVECTCYAADEADYQRSWAEYKRVCAASKGDLPLAPTRDPIRCYCY